MFATVILFPMPADTDWDAVAATAQERAESYYRDMPGLISKSFLINRETGLYGGAYAWDSEASFQSFRDSDTFRAAMQKFGEPQVQTFEIPAHVESGIVTLNV